MTWVTRCAILAMIQPQSVGWADNTSGGGDAGPAPSGR
jgi:hypothetical protein